MRAQTIFDQTKEMLMQADKAGCITSHERRAAVSAMEEAQIYAESPSMAMREGFFGREAQARETITKAQPTTGGN